MGKRGEIYILDMGEPVRILDLARDLIRLSGFRPDADIKIEFTGIRPGEKIFEELLYDEEQTARTAHEKIFVSNGNGVNPATVLRDVDRLIMLASEGERDTLRDEILRIARSGFSPDGWRAAGIGSAAPRADLASGAGDPDADEEQDEPTPGAGRRVPAP
jgi:FlaA1/EpsC-like NDP-sugar epimerase